MTRSRSRADRVTVVAIATILVVLAGAIVYGIASSDDPPAEGASTNVVREGSHRLGEAGTTTVTLVEFLDFECESCRAAYPFVEELRERYAGRVTFVMRYFPLPGHRNSTNAAHAVEAAARQGKLEEMYRRMFETQAEWGESSDSKAALFRTYADDLGLDLDRYDADVASDEVAQRVRRDVDDGEDLSVTGTPTFFLDGQRLEPTSTDEFTQAIDDALARAS